jgi:hypothetical protein
MIIFSILTGIAHVKHNDGEAMFFVVQANNEFDIIFSKEMFEHIIRDFEDCKDELTVDTMRIVEDDPGSLLQ